MIKFIYNIFNKYNLLWYLLFPILGLIYNITASLYEKGYSIMLPKEELIPMMPVFIVPYIYWYLYIIIGFAIIGKKNEFQYKNFLLTLYLGMCICYLIYAIFPTEYMRPIVDNSTIFNKLINIIYSMDKPFNCFPSIHVLSTYCVMRFTGKNNKIIYCYTIIVGILIILSTVFIKQHFILDIIGSILIVEILKMGIEKLKQRK